MDYIKGIEHYINTEPSVITLGKFDGIHMGHRLLLSRMRAVPLKKLVFTFNMEDLVSWTGSDRQFLTTEKERNHILEGFAPDVVLECGFGERMRNMEPEAFVCEILMKQLNVKHIIVGSDYTFGKKAAGDAKMLQALSAKYGYKIQVLPKVRYLDQEISSSRIREAVSSGDMEAAVHMLGSPYPVHGEIVRGKQLGRKIGFPTANILIPKEKLMPPNGVYTSFIRVFDPEKGSRTPWMESISNVGLRPTVEETDRKNLETNILDYQPEGELYGFYAEVGLTGFVRPEKKFDSVDELKAQITEDKKCFEKEKENALSGQEAMLFG